MTEVVHISSHATKVGSEIRQRCVWCGVTLIEVDLRFIAVQAEHADEPYPVWPVDAFIGKDGGATYVVEPTPDHKVPPTFCGAPNDLSSLDSTPPGSGGDERATCKACNCLCPCVCDCPGCGCGNGGAA